MLDFPCNQFLNQAPEDHGDKESKAFEKLVETMILKNVPNDIKWNFGKFLVDGNGKVVARYSPAYTPERLVQDIENLLA